jgi:hypothetical protein
MISSYRENTVIGEPLPVDNTIGIGDRIHRYSPSVFVARGFQGRYNIWQ